MIYIEKNCRIKLVMIRFREIASVRLPGNRFRRRHMSPKGIRPGTWSRRWTVNLVTAGGARRAVSFINTLFLISNFWKIIWKFSKKNISRNCILKCSKNIPKFEKKLHLRKKWSALIWDFQLSTSAIYIRVRRRMLHLPLELLTIQKKISKIKIPFFQKYSAIEVWDYSFPETKDQWGYFWHMSYT